MPASNITGVFTATDVYDRAINDMWTTSGFFGDPNFNNTVLLLSGNGTNNANNSIFLNSSTGIANGPVAINNAIIYSSWGGGSRSSNYSVQYSDDNIIWTTAFSGIMASSACGLITGTGGGGSYGAHNYWRYVVGSAIDYHHPRVSRISLTNGTTTYDVAVFVADNCADSGTIPATGDSYGDFTVTKAGNASQGTFSPYGDKWSTRFTGRNYLSTAAHSNYDITGGDFTIEFWINWEAGNTMGSSGFNISTNFVSTVGWDLGFSSASASSITSLNFQTYNAGWTATTNTAITDANLKRNTWNHLAVVRTGGTGFGILTYYLNGVATGGTFSAPSYPGAGNDLYWGIYAQNYSYSGNPTFSLSNFRIVKGTAVYTKNFTPPVRSLTNVTNTTLLTHNNNRFKNTANALTTFTPAGPTNPEITKFGSDTTAVYNPVIHGGSTYFDGTGDYLTFPITASNQLSGDFTVEFWSYFIARGTNGSGLINNYNSYTTGAFGIFAGHVSVDTTKYQFAYNGAAFPAISSTVTIKYNQWAHIAVVRSGTIITLYIDGVAQGTLSSAGATLNGVGSNWYVGAAGDAIANYSSTGYTSDLRIIKGSAIYTGNFTPPTAPLLPSGTSSIYPNTANVNTIFSAANTSLLCNFTNSGIVDSTGIINLETQTNAKISTTQFNSGGSSMFFDGSSTLSIPYTPLLNFSSGNFTIEFWTYVTATPSAEQYFLSAGPAGGGAVHRGWRMGAHNGSAAGIYFYAGGIAGNAETLLGSFPSINAWHHIAIVRNGTTITGYVNGTALGTTINASTTAITDIISGDYSFIGALQGGAPTGRLFYNGYIDELRITKGVARYTANFTLQNPGNFPNFYAPN